MMRQMRFSFFIYVVSIAFACSDSACLCAQSLWGQCQNNLATMFTDNKAHQMGDIVTVVISESSSASRKSSTKTDKSASVSGSVSTLLYPSGIFQHKKSMPALSWSSENDFEGGGEIQTSDSLTVSITAIIKDIYPNGHLLIQGRKEVTVDREKRFVYVSGIARPRDISSANMISSDKLAEFRVKYEGQGPLGDNQKRGFLTKLVDLFAIF